MLILYMKFQDKAQAVLDRIQDLLVQQTDGQAIPVCPLNFFKVWGIKTNYRTVFSNYSKNKEKMDKLL